MWSLSLTCSSMRRYFRTRCLCGSPFSRFQPEGQQDADGYANGDLDDQHAAYSLTEWLR